MSVPFAGFTVLFSLISMGVNSEDSWWNMSRNKAEELLIELALRCCNFRTLWRISDTALIWKILRFLSGYFCWQSWAVELLFWRDSHALSTPIWNSSSNSSRQRLPTLDQQLGNKKWFSRMEISVYSVLSMTFGIFVVTHTVANCLLKLIGMPLFFCRNKLNFLFSKSLFLFKCRLDPNSHGKSAQACNNLSIQVGLI